MRIVAGRLRGKKLAEVGQGDAAAHLRPTTDRVRESLFNVLTNGKFGNPVAGARVLDLFAGTGALGLEALSRGADHVTFVDDGIAARALLRDNVGLCQAQGVTKIFRRDACDLGEVRGAPFDLIFLDPPYGQGLGERAIASARLGGWIAPDAVIVWEDSAPPNLPSGFCLLDQRTYGGTVITIARAEGA
ncbi:MAG: 16S rRNA (guanine(966)-N(2))-methyltransferase RsmD [Roseicyclus sp.]